MLGILLLIRQQRRRSPSQRFQRVGFDVMEITRNHEEMQRLTKGLLSQRRQPIGGDNGIRTPGARNNDREFIVPVGCEQFGGVVGSQKNVYLPMHGSVGGTRQ